MNNEEGTARDIPATLAMIRARIESAAQRAGRQWQDVEIVAVTKSHPPEIITAVLDAGLTHIGENKVQEAMAKSTVVGGRGTWHLIGHLQSNKVKTAVSLFDAIDAVDSLPLATEIDRRADALGKTIPVLIEINVAGERTKFGVKPDQASQLAEAINALSRLELRGFMGMAPFCTEPADTRPVFAGLRECRDRVERETGLKLPVLSMGMSHDFETAVEEGSTMVRLGTILLGERKSPWRKPSDEND